MINLSFNIQQTIRLSLLLVLMLLLSFMASASHVMAGTIKYKSLGNNRYYIETSAIIDCSAIASNPWVETIRSICKSNLSVGWKRDTVDHIFFIAPKPTRYGGPYAGIKNAAASQNVVSEEVSEVCDKLLDPSRTPNTKCRGNGNTTQGFIRKKFSKIITLVPCNTWRIGFSPLCCRNTGSSNIKSAGLYTETVISTKDYPLNSSPEFFDETRPLPTACVGNKYYYAASAHDLEGDSLRFELSCTMQDSARCVSYNTGFSATQPISGITMDSLTGLISFTPSTIGKRVVSYWVKEYDRCERKLKAKTLRDIHFSVESCFNKSPFVSNPLSNLTGNATSDTNNVITVCEGETISWNEVIMDTLPSFDSINMKTNVLLVLPNSSYKILNTGRNDSFVVRYTWKAIYGNSATKIVASTYSDAFCSHIGSTGKVTHIEVLPSVTVGADLTACIGDTLSLKVTGASKITWRTISGTQLQTGVNWFPIVNATDTNKKAKLIVTRTTVLEVSGNSFVNICNNSVIGCNSIDTIVITANDSFKLFNIIDTLLCRPANNSIGIKTSKPSGKYTYLWSPAQFLDSATSSAPKLNNLTNYQNFTVTVTSDSGCFREGFINVRVSNPFPFNSSISDVDSLLCSGDTIKMKFLPGIPDYGDCQIYTTPCLGSEAKKTIGVGGMKNDSVSENSPLIYPAKSKSGKLQLLYRAKELQKLGLEKGLLTSLNFEVDKLPALNSVFKNYSIKLGCTNDSNVAIFSNSSLNLVHSSTNYSPKNGWNTHTFDAGYAWDGTSNLLIEICWITDSVRSFHPILKYDASIYESARIYSHKTSSNACSEKTLGFFYRLLPRTQFGYCKGVKPENLTYKWSPFPSSSTAGFIGSTYADSVLVSAGLSNTKVYELEITDSAGVCSEKIYKNVNLLTKYNAKPDSMGPKCSLNSLIQLTAPTPSNITNPGGVWSGAGIVDARNGLWDRKKSGAGTFSVYYEIIGNSCASKDSSTITILTLPNRGIQPKEFACASFANVAEHQLIGINSGGIFSGFGVDSIILGGITKYFVNGTRFNPTLQIPDTAVIRHQVGSLCINDTIIKIPVFAIWDTTYLGVYNNGIPVFTDVFCSSSQPDTLAVAGRNPIWRVVDTTYKSSFTDTVFGIFNPSNVNNGKGGKVEIEVENKGFCGGKGRFFIDVVSAPEVKVLTEDFCFNIPSNCIGSGVPANKQLDTLMVRVAKHPFTKIDIADTATYREVSNANIANTGWNELSSNATNWNGYFWMNYTDRCEHSFCSLPKGNYPIVYKLGLNYRPLFKDSICYSVDSTAVIIDNNYSLTFSTSGTLCFGNGTVEIIGVASRGISKYTWNTGVKAQRIFTKKPGIYTVKAVYKYCDVEKSYELGSCVGLEELKTQFKAQLYPNPTKDKIQLKMKNSEGSISLSVYTIAGQLVAEYKFEAENGILEAEIDVSKLQAGIYSFAVSNSTKTNIYRVIIQ